MWSYPLNNYKMVVTIVIDQSDSRHTDLRQFIQGKTKAISLKAFGLQIIFHIQQREAVTSNLFLIPILVHEIKYIMLVDRKLVMIGQQGGDCRGSAAIVPLLFDCEPKPGFVTADDWDVELYIGGRDEQVCCNALCRTAAVCH